MRDSRTFKAAVIAAGTGSSTLVGLAIAAVLARHLTKIDYATYQQTTLVYSLAAPLLGLGLPAALMYFLPRSPDRERNVVSEVLLVLCGVGLLFSAAIYLGGAEFIAARFDNPDLRRTLRWYALFPLLALPLTALHPCLVALDRVGSAAAFTFASQALRLLLVLLPILLIAPNPLYAIQAGVAAAALVVLPGLILIRRAARTGTFVPSPAGAWTQLGYAFPLGISSIIGMLTIQTDKFLVSALHPAETFAVYVNGAIEIPLIGIISGSVAATILPDLVRQHAAGEYAECISLWARGGLKTAAVMLPVAVFLFIAAPELMTLLYSSAYVESAEPFRIYVCALPFRVVMYGVMLQAAGLSRVILGRTALTLALNVVLSLGLMRILGANGAAWGTLLATVCFAVPFNLIVIARVFRVRLRNLFPFGKLLAILICSVIGNLPTLVALKLLGHVSGLALGVSFVSSALLSGLILEFAGVIDLRELRDLLLYGTRDATR